MKTNQVRCITEINFKQLTNNRGLELSFDFVNEFSANDSWVDLTNQCKITFPKNIYVRDKENNLFPLGGTQSDKQLTNLFQRGDSVSISYGYYMYENGNETKEVTKIFTGFVSNVTSKKPIQLECEDNMWLLKQIPCPPQVWPKDKTVEDLLRKLLKDITINNTKFNFTVNALTSTTVGDLIVGNETVAQLLERLRKDFHLESYFSGDELRIGSQVYIESEAVENMFVFQQNIIQDDLEYRRKDDIKLSAIVNSINTVTNDATNKRGKTKTKQERISVLVYSDAQGNFKHIKKQKNVDFPENVEGERRTLFYPNVKSENDLAQKGIDELKKYYYTGFKGKFTTFAVPFVKMGDNVRLKDEVLPDRNGLYKVRGVEYTGGVQGHRQIITLDYKLK